MYDIFLSYSSQDRERVRPLYEYLEKQGWSVFWDHLVIRAGTNWRSKIETAINNSRCVVVVWSKHSINSEFVIEEADIAKNRKVLVTISLGGVAPPLGFKGRQTIAFKSLSQKPEDFQFKKLFEAIGYLLQAESLLPAVVITNTKKNKSRLFWLAVFGLTACLVTVFIVRFYISKSTAINNSAINKYQAIRTLEEIRNSGVLNIATRNNVPPMGFEKGGDLLGIDIELANKLASSLDVKPKLIFFNDITQREEMLVNTTVDVVISSYSRTEAREKKVGFSKPYFNSASVVMIRSTDQDIIKNYVDLNHKKVAVLQGSINEGDLRQFAPYAEIKSIEGNMNIGYENLYKGNIDAVAYDKPMIEYYIANNPDKKFRMISAGSFNPNNYAIGVNLNNESLLVYVDSFLEKLMQAGFLDDLSNKYSTSSIKIEKVQCGGFSENYLIKKDDTLSKIAFNYYGDPTLWDAIYACNRDRVEDAGLIKAGWQIKLTKSLGAN